MKVLVGVSLCFLGLVTIAQGQTVKSINLSPEVNFVEIEVQPGEEIVISTSTNGNETMEVGFSILQANVYLSTLTLSYNRTLSRGYFTTGANIGLVLFGEGENEVYLRNSNEELAHVLLGLHVYDSNAPIPGACNMEQSIQTAPFLPTLFTSSVLMVDYPPASWPLNVEPPTCDGSPLEYDIYHRYLPENGMNRETLFANIRLMSDWKSIQIYGKKEEFVGHPQCRIEFANYLGTGRIVAIVVRGLTSSAAYVPTASYGCMPNSDSEPCSIFYTVTDKLFGACLVFIGLFLTTVGHRFFKGQVFLVGFCMASIISCVLLFLFAPQLSMLNVALILGGVGVVGGLVLFGIWAATRVPAVPIFLSSLILGFVFASTVAYTPLVDFGIFKDNITFWFSFSCLLLIIPLTLVSFPRIASIVFSSFVGSYLFIFPLDQYFGSSLTYIVLNMLRRATDLHFESAIIDPPFQLPDLVLTIVWALLALGGLIFQLQRERGRTRPPFPLPPTRPAWLSKRFARLLPRSEEAMAENYPDENTPLLS